MTNSDINNYRKMGICDAHIHLHVEARLDKSVSIFKSIIEHFEYEKIALQSLPTYDLLNNYKALYFKTAIDGVYANLGLIHNFDSTDNKEYYAAHVKELYDMGCDGFKMFEGKPEYRNVFNRSLCNSALDAFYEFAQEKGLPVLLHCGDPPEFWDPERIPEWARKRGWLYDENAISLSAVREEAFGILKKFPGLKVTFAHFFFTSDDIDYADNLMQTWKNVSLDITPGTEMYFNFEKNPDEWRKFFIKYADRIVYGSDIYNWDRDNKTTEKRYAHSVNLLRSFLEKGEPFKDAWTGALFEHPFNLPDDVLDKIYRDNFYRIYGRRIRPVDKELVAYNCKNVMKNGDLSALETANIRHIITEFSK